MHGYQFAHVETWSASGASGTIHHESGDRKNGQKSWTAAEILDEAERRPGSSFHVERGGEPPQILAGAVGSFDELRAAHEAASTLRERFNYTDPKTKTKSVRHRKLRWDARSLYTCVVSLPVEAEAVRHDPRLRAESVGVLEAAIAHERERIESLGGAHMLAVVHWDERQIHAHLYALDPERGRVNSLHPGMTAKRAFLENLRNAGLSKKDRNAGGNRAYCDAMRGWQNDLHEEVFKDCGLLRVGPRRERLSRTEWHQAKTASGERIEDRERQKYLSGRAADLQEMGEQMLASHSDDMALRQEWTADLDARSRSLADYEASLMAQRKAIEGEADDVARREARIVAEKREIAARAEAVTMRDAEVSSREIEAAARVDAAGKKEAVADASLAAVEAIVEGVAEAVVVDGKTRLRPAKSESATLRWPGLKVRMSAAPDAALGMAARLRGRID